MSNPKPRVVRYLLAACISSLFCIVTTFTALHAAEISSTTQAAPIANAGARTDGAHATHLMATEADTQTVTEIIYVTETVQVIVPVTEIIHVTETHAIDVVVPVTQTVVVTETVEDHIPVNETVYVTETVQQIVPVTQLVVVTETVQQVVPLTQTVIVTETVQQIVAVNQNRLRHRNHPRDYPGHTDRLCHRNHPTDHPSQPNRLRHRKPSTSPGQTEVGTVQQIIPVNQTVFVTETVQQIIPVNQTVFVTETIQQIIPVTQTVFVTATIQQIIPVNQTIFVTETIPQVIPVTKTVIVTETQIVTRLVDQIVPIKEVTRVTQTIRVGPPAPIFVAPVTNTLPLSGTEGRAPRLPVVSNWAALSPTYWEQTPLPVSGVAMYYNPFVMDGVLRYRQNVGNIDSCPECVGYIALLRAGDINRRVWIHWLMARTKDPFR
ncbi:MAG: hypothetical protein IPK16_25395 [Anaerolineales bacterium]|nr:hypothetical protein [Anaerolineales bacterium]